MKISRKIDYIIVGLTILLALGKVTTLLIGMDNFLFDSTCEKSSFIIWLVILIVWLLNHVMAMRREDVAKITFNIC